MPHVVAVSRTATWARRISALTLAAYFDAVALPHASLVAGAIALLAISLPACC